MPCSHWPSGASQTPRNPVCTQGRSRDSSGRVRSADAAYTRAPGIPCREGRVSDRPGSAAPCSRELFHSGRAGLSSLRCPPALSRWAAWRWRFLWPSGRALRRRRRGRPASAARAAPAGRRIGGRRRRRPDQLRFAGGAACGGVNAGQMPRATENQDDPHQDGDEAGPEVGALQVAQGRSHRGLGHTRKHGCRGL